VICEFLDFFLNWIIPKIDMEFLNDYAVSIIIVIGVITFAIGRIIWFVKDFKSDISEQIRKSEYKNRIRIFLSDPKTSKKYFRTKSVFSDKKEEREFYLSELFKIFPDNRDFIGSLLDEILKEYEYNRDNTTI